MLDEVEELELVIGHYIVTWGSTAVDESLKQWKLPIS